MVERRREVLWLGRHWSLQAARQDDAKVAWTATLQQAGQADVDADVNGFEWVVGGVNIISILTVENRFVAQRALLSGLSLFLALNFR